MQLRRKAHQLAAAQVGLPQPPVTPVAAQGGAAAGLERGTRQPARSTNTDGAGHLQPTGELTASTDMPVAVNSAAPQSASQSAKESDSGAGDGTGTGTGTSGASTASVSDEDVYTTLDPDVALRRDLPAASPQHGHAAVGVGTKSNTGERGKQRYKHAVGRHGGGGGVAAAGTASAAAALQGLVAENDDVTDSNHSQADVDTPVAERLAEVRATKR
jgi:hypothetical protein